MLCVCSLVYTPQRFRMRTLCVKHVTLEYLKKKIEGKKTDLKEKKNKQVIV